MISILLVFFCIYFFARIMNKAQEQARQAQPVRAACPPHSWSWEKVYNEDGSLHHQHLVCAKCGPLHGVRNNE